jgi:hypothetical protein
MRLTYASILPAAMAQADALRARTGYTPEAWAATLVTLMQQTPPSPQRDAAFSNAMQVIGVNVAGLADFERKAEGVAERAWETRASDRARTQIEHETQGAPTPWDSAQLRFTEARIQQSDALQRIADRFRERDEHARRHERELVPSRPELNWRGQDAASRRAVVAHLFDHQPDDDHARLPQAFSDARPSLRDTIAASFDMHEARELFNDPLMDDGLIGATDMA